MLPSMCRCPQPANRQTLHRPTWLEPDCLLCPHLTKDDQQPFESILLCQALARLFVTALRLRHSRSRRISLAVVLLFRSFQLFGWSLLFPRPLAALEAVRSV